MHNSLLKLKQPMMSLVACQASPTVIFVSPVINNFIQPCHIFHNAAWCNETKHFVFVMQVFYVLLIFYRLITLWTNNEVRMTFGEFTHSPSHFPQYLLNSKVMKFIAKIDKLQVLVFKKLGLWNKNMNRNECEVIAYFFLKVSTTAVRK